MRKVLKKEPISAEQMRRTAKALPEFNRKQRPLIIPDLPSLRFLWCDGNGKPGKRAFFFSLARFVALIYIIACMIDPKLFIGELAIFIGAVLGETGVNHYQNERLMTRNYSIPGGMPTEILPPIPGKNRPPKLYPGSGI